MSLYSHEEICRDCEHGQWVDGDKFWDGRPRFMRCRLSLEDGVDHYSGRCSGFRQFTSDGPAGGEARQGGEGA